MTIYDNLLLTIDNCTQIKHYFANNKREELKMKTLTTIKKYFFLSLIIFLASNYISMNYAQNGKSLNSDKMKVTMESYERYLDFENHGIRMSVVEYVGRYKMSNFENKLIEMLNNEQDAEDKQIIALSLFQLGSLKSITEIKNSLLISNDDSYKEFCSSLLHKYEEYDKLRSEYFETLVDNLLETE